VAEAASASETEAAPSEGCAPVEKLWQAVPLDSRSGGAVEAVTQMV